VNGNAAEAAFHAKQIANDQYPLSHLARALAAAAGGDRDTARQSIDRLVALRPAWRERTRQELERFFYAKPLVDRLERDLVAAGINDAR
jgi:histidinol-phosphate/aromatic aminotransferase/cobyric acid decarboxylase-like protein